MTYIKLYHCKLKDMNGIYAMSQTLANYFPKPEQCVIGIHELLLNAVEHGNLGIGFETKTALIREGKWQEEIIRRLALPENSGKEVKIRLSQDENECRLTIADQGEGFPWRDYIGRPASDKRPSGRGLWIAYSSKFDRILFNARGNEVTCVAEYRHWPGPDPVSPHAA